MQTVWSLDHFLSQKPESGQIAISFGPTTLHLCLKDEGQMPLVVFFTPAVQRRPGDAAPFFTGRGLTDGLPASLLAIDDPALQYSPELGLAWMAGTKDIPLQDILPRVISHVASSIGATKLILTGPSGGGFASLYYGTRIPGSLVLAVNPQTDILRYGRTFFEQYARVCFDWSDGPIENAFGKTVTCLPKHYYRGARASAVYLQNNSDWHIKPHAIPLIRALGGITEPVDQTVEGVDFIFRDWGQGHAPLPKPVYRSVLQHLIEFGKEGVSNTVDDALSIPLDPVQTRNDPMSNDQPASSAEIRDSKPAATKDQSSS